MDTPCRDNPYQAPHEDGVDERAAEPQLRDSNAVAHTLWLLCAVSCVSLASTMTATFLPGHEIEVIITAVIEAGLAVVLALLALKVRRRKPAD